MKRLVLAGAALALGLQPGAVVAEPLTATGPEGELVGTLVRPAAGRPLILILPGSGPTDRDGNNPAGVAAAPYRLLAEALAQRGIGTLRVDKRGMFASRAAVADPNAVTLDAYAADVTAWVASARQATGADCLWVLGHSEGGLVALVAAQKVEGLCGVILVAAPGRPLGSVLRDQLQANPANAPLLADALSAIDRLEKGERVEVSAMHPALQGLFNPAVQGFLIDVMRHDPGGLAATISLPMLIVQGGKDLQVGSVDGEALRAGQPHAKYVVVSEMNHVLKPVYADTPQANYGTYSDPSIPVAPELVDAIDSFVCDSGQRDGKVR